MQGETGDRPTGVRYLVLLALCSLAFLTYFDRICISRAQDDIKRDLNLYQLPPMEWTAEQVAAARDDPKAKPLDRHGAWTNEEILEGKHQDAAAVKLKGEDFAKSRMGWIFNAFMLSYVLFEVPCGWLGDTWGVRQVILRIVVWWSAFTALTGCSDLIVVKLFGNPSMWTMLLSMCAVRFLFGLGEAGAYPSISRVLSRWFPARQRSRVQGTIRLASRWGGAFSPLLFGQMMLLTGSWRVTFYVLGVIGVAWAVGFYWWFRNTPEEMPHVNRAECELITTGRVQKGSIYDDAGHVPLPWSKLFSPNLMCMYLAATCSSFCWYFYAQTFLVYLGQTFRPVSDREKEWMLFTVLAGGGVCCILGGLLSDLLMKVFGRRWGRSLPGVIAFSAAAACLFIVVGSGLALDAAQIKAEAALPEAERLAAQTARQQLIWVAVALVAVAAAVHDLHMAPLWSLTADIGGRYAGTVAGTLNMICNVGGFTGTLLVPMLSKGGGWKWLFLVNGAVYCLGAVLWLFVDANKKLLDPPAEGEAA